MYEIEPLNRVRGTKLLKVLSLCQISSATHSPHGTYGRVVLVDLCPSPTFDTAGVGAQFPRGQNVVRKYSTAS